MESYIFQGVVLPERAQLSFSMPPITYTPYITGVPLTATISVVLNQVAVWIDSDYDWDIFDLRNIVKSIVQNELNIIGYLLGRAYDLEITRVLNRSKNIDEVFGIDIPCIAKRNKWSQEDLTNRVVALHEQIIGQNGIFLNRCFNDLVSAMKNADDTAFYCYRAIESLRHHCIHTIDLSSLSDPKKQWDKFREVAKIETEDVMYIKNFADDLRHGKPIKMTSDERKELFIKTWDIVDSYLKNIELRNG